MTFAPRFALAAVLLICLLAPSPAFAQGSGLGHAYGLNKAARPSGPSAAGSEDLHTGGTGVRNFGAWLDDASVMPEGRGFVSVGFGLYKTPEYREFDVPTMDAGIAVHRRVQVSMSVPYYHASAPGGPVARGFGDMYLSTKVQLRDPAAHKVGFAVTPTIEVLTAAPTPDGSRVSWAMPGNIEVQREGWRAFGSAGYFSRGSLFASAGLERALSDRWWVTGSLTHAYSMHPDDLSVAMGLAQIRTDVSAGASYAARPNIAVFGAVGRTISKQDVTSTSLTLSGGLSISVAK